MEIKIEVAGARLDKALADLTPLSRAVALSLIHIYFHPNCVCTKRLGIPLV